MRRSKSYATLGASLLSVVLLATACSQGTAGSGEGDADGPFEVGYLLPETGPSAALGPAMIEAVELAVDDINAEGGVLGREVELTGGDDAGDTNLASQAFDRLLSQQVRAVMGPGSTSIALALIDKLARSQTVMCSGATTGPQLTEVEDQGFYFRTIYSNLMQGRALAELAVGDQRSKVAILARNDAYGTPLMQEVSRVLESEGVEVVSEITYPPDAVTFDAEFRQMETKGPDAVVLLGLDERTQMLKTMTQLGIGPTSMPVYTAGTLPGDAVERVDPGNPGAIEGVQGTNPPTLTDSSFMDRIEATGNNAYAPNQYDCLIITALAATAADSPDPSKFKDFMSKVTTGDNECSTYGECKELLEDDKTVAYVGPAGVLKLDDAGDPTVAKFDLYRVNGTGEVEVTRQLELS